MQNPRAKKVLLVGASGATGRLLAGQLLYRGAQLKAVVRSPDRLDRRVREHPRTSAIHASLLELGATELRQLTDDCDAVVSCLGHNLTFKGLFGPPYRLVTEATRRLAEALQAKPRKRPARFVLMNTAGNSNRGLDEPRTPGHRLVIGLLRLALPPHADNERAAEYLRRTVGTDDAALEWCVVRPDTLTDDTQTSGYEVFPSPVRDAIFDPGRTSRLNVARFMAELVVDDETWKRWRGRMPVIYDRP